MNEDFKKLKGYLDERFANLASKADLDNLTANLLTLEEFAGFKQEVNQSFNRSFEVFATRDGIGEIKEELAGLKEIVQALTISVDKLVKAVSDLKTEYSIISHQLTRHEKWIQQLAEKVGINLEF